MTSVARSPTPTPAMPPKPTPTPAMPPTPTKHHRLVRGRRRGGRSGLRQALQKDIRQCVNLCVDLLHIDYAEVRAYNEFEDEPQTGCNIGIGTKWIPQTTNIQVGRNEWISMQEERMVYQVDGPEIKFVECDDSDWNWLEDDEDYGRTPDENFWAHFGCSKESEYRSECRVLHWDWHEITFGGDATTQIDQTDVAECEECDDSDTEEDWCWRKRGSDTSLTSSHVDQEYWDWSQIGHTK